MHSKVLFEFAKRPDAGSCEFVDIAERYAFPEQGQFLCVLLPVLGVRLFVAGRPSKRMPLFVLSSFLQIFLIPHLHPGAYHAPFHLGDLQ